MEENKLDTVWQTNPETIKKYFEQKNDYEQICAEIAYILKKELSKNSIEYSAVSYRAKTLNSFLEKIVRKTYQDPFKEINDFGGVRVVFLYQNDFVKIEALIKKEFNVIEKVDKLNDKGIDKFGYGAIHYIVKLGKNSSGARYDDLKNLPCEIQVRTVLQDAWAIIDHHLAYKNESQIPSSLQRKLNSLAGLFETADNQFDILRQERQNYLIEVKESITSNDFLANELNLDTFTEFLKWKFPNKKVETFTGQAELVFTDVAKLTINNLEDLNKIIDKYIKNLPTLRKEIMKVYSSMKLSDWSSSVETAYLVAIEYEDFSKSVGLKSSVIKILSSYKK